jgi:hypothetical protein
MNVSVSTRKQEDIIEAVPLLLKTISRQIKDAGGEGFNVSVKVEPVKGSFSCVYRFDTSEGRKAIRTKNVFLVGIVYCTERHFVQFDADENEYVLVTPKEATNKVSKRLLITPLGKSFDEMFAELKKLWPERAIWSLTKPNFLNY